MNTELLNEIENVKGDEIPLTETEKIRIMNSVRKKLPKKKNKIFIIAKAAGALAACYALLIGISVVNPVFADTFPIIRELPFAEKIIYSLNHVEGHSYQSPVIRSGAVENYLNTVEGNADSDFRILESYCDGTALVLSTVMKVDGVDTAVKHIEPVYNISINGTPVTIKTADAERTDLSEYFYNLIRVDDSVYAGSIILDVSNMDLGDAFDLNVNVVSLLGVDNEHLIQDNIFSDTYKDKTYEINTVPSPVEAQIKVDTSLKKTYEVGETQDVVTLNNVTVSPSSTYIDYSIEGDNTGDQVVMFLYDSDGNSIPWLKFGFETNKTYYKPILKDTTSITAKFFRMSNRKQSVAEFNIPVEGGFADIYEPPVETVDNSNVVYDPPIFAPKGARPAGAKVYEIGDTMVAGHTEMSVTYSNMQVFNNIEEAGIPAEDMNDSEYEDYAGDDKYRFVTFDVNMKTSEESYGMEVIDEEAKEYEKFNDTSSTYWISNYFRPELISGGYDMNNDTQHRISNEPAYFSSAMRGISNYYHFIMNPNDERDFVVGAYVALADLESGNFQIVLDDSGSANVGQLYLTIPPYTE